jgi:hypothetical protein
MWQDLEKIMVMHMIEWYMPESFWEQMLLVALYAKTSIRLLSTTLCILAITLKLPST